MNLWAADEIGGEPDQAGCADEKVPAVLRGVAGGEGDGQPRHDETASADLEGRAANSREAEIAPSQWRTQRCWL
jgi:hypothetical protein